MTYEAFDPDRPDVAAGTRKEEIDKARNNFVAMQDVLASLGWMPDFDIEITDGTPDLPEEITATNGMQVIRTTITYGSGVTADLPVTILLEKSTDGGSSWDSIRTATIAYTVGGEFDGMSWS